MLEPLLSNAVDSPDRISTVVYFNTAQLVGAPGLVVNPGVPFVTAALNLEGAANLYLVADTAGGGGVALNVGLATVDPLTESPWNPATSFVGLIPGGLVPGIGTWIYTALLTADVTALWANAIRFEALVGPITINRISLWAWGPVSWAAGVVDGV